MGVWGYGSVCGVHRSKDHVVMFVRCRYGQSRFWDIPISAC